MRVLEVAIESHRDDIAEKREIMAKLHAASDAMQAKIDADHARAQAEVDETAFKHEREIAGHRYELNRVGVK